MNPGTQFCPQDGAALKIGEEHTCQGVPGIDYTRTMGRAAMNYLSRAGLEPMDLRQLGDHVIFTSTANLAALKRALPWRTFKSLGSTIWQVAP